MSLLPFLNDLIFVTRASLSKRLEIRVFQSVLQLFLGCSHFLPHINLSAEIHPGIQSILLHFLTHLVHSLLKNVHTRGTSTRASTKTCPKPGKTYLIPCKCYQARVHCLTHLGVNTMALAFEKRNSFIVRSVGKETGSRTQFYLLDSGFGVKFKGLREFQT